MRDIRYMSRRFICRSARGAKKPLRNASVASMSQSPLIRGIINEFLDERETKGLETYGRTLDDVDDGRDWSIEVIQELLDALQYAAKEIKDLREQLKTPFD